MHKLIILRETNFDILNEPLLIDYTLYLTNGNNMYIQKQKQKVTIVRNMDKHKPRTVINMGSLGTLKNIKHFSF